MTPDGKVFAIHCEMDEELHQMTAGVVVVEPGCMDGWLDMVIPQLYGGNRFLAKLPVALTDCSSRTKGYNVRLPISAIER